MKVLIAGLSDQSAAAMARVVDAVYPGAQVIRQQRGVSVDAPAAWAVTQSCDLCIVDLIGLGLARWTEQRQQQLQALVLNDHCAVVLAPPGDGGGWLQALQAAGSARVTLQHPLRATAMRTTLQELRAQDDAAAKAAAKALSRASRPAVQPAAQPLPAAPAAPTAPMAQAAPTAPTAPTASTASTVAAAAATAAAPAAPAAAAAAFAPPPAAARPARTLALPEPVELHDALDHVPQPEIQGAATTSAALPPAPSPAPPPPAPKQPPRRGRGRLGAPLPPAWDEAPETFSVAPDEPVRAAPQPALAQPDVFGLTREGFDALVAVCPEATQNAYLNLICQAALKAEPQEFQIGSHSGVVVHAANNWVVSNISSALRKRLTAHAMMLQIIESRPLSDDAAFATAARLFGRRQDGRRPLDTFVWGLAFNTFEAAPPPATGDLRFQLRRFPNFTRMAQQPDLFIQLALLCLRAPQSLLDLQRSFSRHDPRLVTLFVVCAVLSGSASVLPALPDAQAVPRDEPSPTARRNRPGLKFLRSLLAKLF